MLRYKLLYTPCCCQGLTGMNNNEAQSPKLHVFMKLSILIEADNMIKYIVPDTLFKCRRD